MSPRIIRTAVAAFVVVLLPALVGCTDEEGAENADAPTDRSTTTAGSVTTTTTAEVDRPEGPAATFAELTAGTPIPPVAAKSGPDLAAANWSETEYAASGTAVSYTAPGGLPEDGRFALEVGDSAPYTTRVLVRRPNDAEDFDGTVVVEWLNVSSGSDAAPDYTYAAEEIVRAGHAWVGVSAQHIGIEGGAVAVPIAANPSAGQGIKAQGPERYGALAHPGDAYAYDMFTQIGRGLRDGGPMDGLDVERLLAIGESQSAFALTTYVNGVQPLTEAFDGFLLHSRGGATMPLGTPGTGISITESVLGPPTRLRVDLDVPVMIVQTETDVLGFLTYFPARQEDTDHLRLWEIAGTAHADSFQLGPVEGILGCPVPINRGQQAYVLRAAVRHLDAWARGGEAPPSAPRLDTTGEGPAAAFVLDDNGNTTGGVRSPVVDAPVDVLSGLPAPASSSIACLIMGTTTPIAPDRLAALYPDRDAYVAAYAAATDAAIDAGFLLEDDREEIVADSQPDRVA